MKKILLIFLLLITTPAFATEKFYVLAYGSGITKIRTYNNAGTLTAITDPTEISTFIQAKASYSVGVKYGTTPALYYNMVLNYAVCTGTYWEDNGTSSCSEYNAEDTYFLHDAIQTSSKIYMTVGGLTAWVPNMGTTYAAAFAANQKQFMEAGTPANSTLYAGGMIDEVHSWMATDRMYAAGVTGNATPDINNATYKSNTAAFLKKVKSADGLGATKLLIYNTLSTATSGVYDDSTLLESGGADGGQRETAFVSSTNNAFPSQEDWQAVLDKQIQVGTTYNKLFFCDADAYTDYADDSASYTTYMNQIALYSFCSYMLGRSDKTYYTFNPNPDNYHSFNWYDYYENDFGSPLETYHESSTTGIFQREFERSLILVNPTAGSLTLNLYRPYETLSGTPVVAVTMNANTGLILNKVSAISCL